MNELRAKAEGLRGAVKTRMTSAKDEAADMAGEVQRKAAMVVQWSTLHGKAD